MPPAIPAVVGYAASAAAVSLSAGAIAAGSFVAAAIGGVASLATSALLGSLSKADAPDLTAQLTQVGAGRATQVRQPISPHQYHYGQAKTSGPILFIHSQEDQFGREFGHLFIVHGLSGGKVKAIRTVYFGDQLASLPKFQLEGSQIRVNKHLGEANQVADADFVSEIGAPKWGTNHRLRGRAYLATRLTWDIENLPQLENISAIVDGIDTIYDPRTGLTGFTNNAALCVANWVTSSYGEGRAWSKIHEPTLIESANICDERVLVISGSITFTAYEDPESPGTYTGELVLAEGARFLDWGDGVRLSSTVGLPSGFASGTTYYVIPGADGRISLATSVANAFAGTAVEPSTAGDGTHTLTYYDEARYKCNGTFTLDMQKGNVLDELRSCMAGYAFPRGGLWFIHAGAAAVPTVTLDDDDLRAHPTVTPKRSIRDRFNKVKGVFVNPDANWQPTDAPPQHSAAYLAEDQGEELITDLRSNFIISERQMQRILKIELERNRRQMEVDVPCKLTAFELAPLDGVLLTLDGYFTAEQHRVTGWALTEDLGVNIKAQVDDSAIYDWSPEDELVGTDFQGLTLPDPSQVPAPPSIIVDTPIEPTYSRLNATITEAKTIWRDGYDVEFRRENYENWSSSGRVRTEQISILTSEAVDIQVRTVARNGVPSSFTQNLAPAMPTDLAVDGGDPLEITWTNGAGAAEVQIFQGVAEFASSVLHDTVAVSGASQSLVVPDDNFYWLRSVNADGNVSDPTTSVQVGTPGGGGSGDGGGDADSGDDGSGDGGGDL